MPLGVDGLADIANGVIGDLPHGIRGDAAVDLGAPFARDANHLPPGVDLVLRDAFFCCACGLDFLWQIASRVIFVFGLDPQCIGLLGDAHVAAGVGGSFHSAVRVFDPDDLLELVFAGLGGKAARVGAGFAPGARVVAHLDFGAAVDPAPHQLAYPVVRVLLHPPACGGLGAGDFADELFVHVVVAEFVVGACAVGGDALFDEFAFVQDAFCPAFVVCDLGDAVADVVTVSDGVATGVGDLGQAVFLVIVVLDAARGQVAGPSRHRVVAHFGQPLAAVVQAQQHMAVVIDCAQNPALAVAQQPDGVVVAVSEGDHLALGVVVHPVSAPVDPAVAFGVALWRHVDLAGGQIGVEGRGCCAWHLAHCAFDQGKAGVEQVDAFFSDIQFAGFADAFGVHRLHGVRARAGAQAGGVGGPTTGRGGGGGGGAQGGVVDAHIPWRGVVGAGVAHRAIEGGGAFGRHRAHVQCSTGQHGAFGGLPAVIDPYPAAVVGADGQAGDLPRTDGACRGVGGLAAGHVFPALRQAFPLGVEFPLRAVPPAAPVDHAGGAADGQVVRVQVQKAIGQGDLHGGVQRAYRLGLCGQQGQ